jgi:hypothetical protein
MRKASDFSLFLFTIGVCLVSLGALAGGPTPQYWPTCTNPQNIAPTNPLGGTSVNARSAVVWNGQNYAVVWVDDGGLNFQKVFADGTLCGSAVVVSTRVAFTSQSPSLVWNGSGYGVAWEAGSPSGNWQVYFARLYADGSINGSEVKASFYGISEASYCFDASLAWGGSKYAVTWTDLRNSNQMDVFATVLNASGGIVAHDVVICNESHTQVVPNISWSQGAGKFVVVWEDGRLSGDAIYASSLTTSGTPSSNTLLVSGSSDIIHPALADSGSGLGMVWDDGRDGNDEIYFARINASGSSKIGSDVRLTNDAGNSWYPRIVWTGAEYGVFWQDDRSGNNEIWFQRVGAGGGTPGISKEVTTTAYTGYPGAAFGQYGFLVTGMGDAGANYALPWGCNDDTSAPTCPGNLLAYSVTGTGATVSWSPAGEDGTDIAYYQIYRNNTALARTANNYYADTGLGAGVTYNYMVQPVNAAQMQNYACKDSMYLKTNATLILMVNKSAPDARLIWTDAGMNNYNIWRGTSPQVMTQIGQTAGRTFDDENVLLDGVVYFYTVDKPGW